MASAKDIAKGTIRRAINAIGYDIIGYGAGSARARLAKLLVRHGITVILDVGANTGQFGREMRDLGFRGRIVSFEPLQDAFARLAEICRTDASWQAVNIGLGDRDEQRIIHVAANSQSSSFLSMLDAHVEAAPESVYQADQAATIHRLENAFAQYCTPADKVFLKIDTQGYEKLVLEGARGILGAVPLVQLECSLVPLYDGAQTIEDTIGLMRVAGYDPVDLQPTFHHRDSGHLMQADLLFARNAGHSGRPGANQD